MTATEKVDTATTEPLTYSVEEAAKLLGVGRALAYEMAKSGELPAIRVGRRRLVVSRAAFHRMLDGER